MRKTLKKRGGGKSKTMKNTNYPVEQEGGFLEGAKRAYKAFWGYERGSNQRTKLASAQKEIEAMKSQTNDISSLDNITAEYAAIERRVAKFSSMSKQLDELRTQNKAGLAKLADMINAEKSKMASQQTQAEQDQAKQAQAKQAQAGEQAQAPSDQAQAEQTQAKQAQAKQAQAEQTQAKQDQAEQTQAEQDQAKQSQAGKQAQGDKKSQDKLNMASVTQESQILPGQPTVSVSDTSEPTVPSVDSQREPGTDPQPMVGGKRTRRRKRKGKKTRKQKGGIKKECAFVGKAWNGGNTRTWGKSNYFRKNNNVNPNPSSAR